MAAIHAAGGSKDLDLTDQIVLSGQAHAYDIMTNYDWMFLRGSTTFTGGSVSGTSTYKLTGTADVPCGRIIEVYYDTYKLEYYPQEEFLSRKQGLTSSNYPVSMWTMNSFASDGFPIIELFGAPNEDDITISYLYQRRVDEADALDLMPGSMMNILRLRLLSEFYPYPDKSGMYAQQAEMFLNSALWSQRPKQTMVTRGVISNDRMQGNREANRLGSRNVGRYYTN